MCGRFTLTLNTNDLQEELHIGDFPPNWGGSRFNIAPSQPVAVVADATSRDVEMMRWGLVPSWAKDVSIGNKLINARAETLMEKPSFRNAFQKRRCLILADGFFEWQKQENKRAPTVPYYFQRAGRKPFAFAGLWEFWRSPEGEPLRSCTLITTTANDLVAPVHERMPVMLTGETCWDWLQLTGTEDLAGLLVPFPADQMVSYPISRMVNDTGIDAPEVLLPVAE
jgi:putative SOS response-associated peptidase YedK